MGATTCAGCGDTVPGDEVVLYGPEREWLCLECVEERTIGKKDHSSGSSKGRQLESGRRARRAWRRRTSPRDQ